MIKNIIVVLVILVILFISFKFFVSKEDDFVNYNKITPKQAKEMMENEDVVLVDVREKEEYEYEYEHIENALLIPLSRIGENKPSQLKDVKKKIIIYCKSGVRSKKAAIKLLNLGYKNIYDMGGILDWPYETIK